MKSFIHCSKKNGFMRAHLVAASSELIVVLPLVLEVLDPILVGWGGDRHFHRPKIPPAIVFTAYECVTAIAASVLDADIGIKGNNDCASNMK